MKKKLIALLFLAGTSVFAGPRFFVGFGVGGYYPAPPRPVYSYYRPAYPGPGYTWVDGYYYPGPSRYIWRPGYYARPPYAGAFWVGPRWHGGRYYAGYWRRRW